ncbi:hypothetical protein D9611_010580 [Ephemerocybe angulata]|uniref:Uncharacterized protein n=1 Tax=Ephemerocybe angulata TaxID=980116 RepID=A0A8H5BVB2_9AGAR|nr:hypothetical protein D9611_010580 [Tulosesus angulatus]
MSEHDTSSRPFLQSLLKASIALSFVTFGSSLAPLRQLWTSRYLVPPACAITIAFDITLLFLSYRQQAREHKESGQDVELEAAKHPLPKSATQHARPAFLSLSPTYHSIAIWALNLIIAVWLTIILLSLSLIVLGDENGATHDAEDERSLFQWYAQITGMALHPVILFGVELWWSEEIKINTHPTLTFVKKKAYRNTRNTYEKWISRMIWFAVFESAACLVLSFLRPPGALTV